MITDKCHFCHEPIMGEFIHVQNAKAHSECHDLSQYNPNTEVPTIELLELRAHVLNLELEKLAGIMSAKQQELRGIGRRIEAERELQRRHELLQQAILKTSETPSYNKDTNGEGTEGS